MTDALVGRVLGFAGNAGANSLREKFSVLRAAEAALTALNTADIESQN